MHGDALLWRISIAEVAGDGPFSLFPGLSRILTVIDGAGIDLHTPANVLPARPSQPVHFSGDLPIHATLVDGAIRDLNLIYDASKVRAAVTPITQQGPVALPAGQCGVYMLSGQAQVDGVDLPCGAFALGSGGGLDLAADSSALCLSLQLFP